MRAEVRWHDQLGQQPGERLEVAVRAGRELPRQVDGQLCACVTWMPGPVRLRRLQRVRDLVVAVLQTGECSRGQGRHQARAVTVLGFQAACAPPAGDPAGGAGDALSAGSAPPTPAVTVVAANACAQSGTVSGSGSSSATRAGATIRSTSSRFGPGELIVTPSRSSTTTRHSHGTAPRDESAVGQQPRQVRAAELDEREELRFGVGRAGLGVGARDLGGVEAEDVADRGQLHRHRGGQRSVRELSPPR